MGESPTKPRRYGDGANFAAAPGITSADRARELLTALAGGAVVGALAGLGGVWFGQLVGAVQASLAPSSPGWAALAASAMYWAPVCFGLVLLIVGSELGEVLGKTVAAAGTGVAVGIIAGAAAGAMLPGAVVGALGGLAGAYLAGGNVVPLVKRELFAYFYSPIAYLVMAAFLVLWGLFFYVYFAVVPGAKPAEMRVIFDWVSFLNIFVAPLITMRLLAEESRSGTMEVLMTAPVTDVEVVLAKYIGSVVFYIVMLAPSLIYVAVLFWLSSTTGPDMGAVWTGYIGLVLTAGVFLAGGLMISSLVTDQLTAAVLSFVLVVGFFIVLMLRGVVTGIPWLSSFVEYASISSHLEAFSKGIIDSRDVVYFVTLTTFFLYATVKSIESRKWR